MRRAHLVCGFVVLALTLSFLSVASAQQASIVEIKKIEPAKAQTPEYKLLTGQVMAKTRTWFAINTTYETKPDWIDDLSFTYYVLVRSKEAGQKYTLFKGDVTYVNVQKGKHKSDMYLHPSTLARYGDVERVAVIVNAAGRVVAMESLPAATTRWWEQLSPVEGYVLNRMQTPFAMINFDDYEAVKTAK